MKKSTAFITALSIALSLAACSSDTGSEDAASNETTTTAAEVMNETTEKADEDSAEEETTTEAETEPPAPVVEYATPAAEDFEYSYDASIEGVIISGYNGSDTAIRIPAEIDGDPVKQILLKENSKITDIELPNSITEINSDVISGCSNLTSINIPDGVTTIDTVAFKGCSKFRSLTLPDSIEKIGNDVFEGCEALTVTYKGQEYNYTNFADLYGLFW